MPSTGQISALSHRYDVEDVHDIEVYEQHGGYEGLRKALDMTSEELIQLVKDSGLRGRGGAGFPTGLKWSFVAQDTGKPIYLVCNADESEPGTFKDRPLLEKDPHSLVEGMVVGGLAINAEYGYIYLRGEFGYLSRRVSRAIAQAYDKGYLGEDVMGTGRRFHLYLHRGAAAYICGEETALLESLEGRRGQPRLRPPFPATHGLYGCPTTVNNVESIVTVPYLVRHGADWYRQWGTEKSAGPKLMCISGDVQHPGNYEFALGTPVSEMIARGAQRQVLVPRRLVDALPHRRAPRHALRLRGDRRGRLAARHRRPDGLRRHALHRRRDLALHEVLRARVLRQVHAVP
jgi:NADH-quinone oxidoreductase subunit F